MKNDSFFNFFSPPEGECYYPHVCSYAYFMAFAFVENVHEVFKQNVSSFFATSVCVINGLKPDKIYVFSCILHAKNMPISAYDGISFLVITPIFLTKKDCF